MKRATPLLLALLILSISIRSDITQSTGASVGVDIQYEWLWDEINRTGVENLNGDDVLIWGPDMGPYYNSAEIAKKLFDAENTFPELISVFEIGKSWMNKSILAARITSPNVGSVEVKYETVVVANHHAREAITVIDILLYMDRILYAYLEGDPTVTKLLDSAELYIVPTLNPDGLDSLYINPWIRKNIQSIDDDQDGTTIDEAEIQDVDGDNYIAQYYDYAAQKFVFESIDGSDADNISGEDNLGGIDLNRNYPFKFIGLGSSEDPSKMNYRGEAPLSAPETKAWAVFAMNHSFFTSVSLHSGIEAIITPWAYTDEPNPEEIEFTYISDSLQKISGFPKWEDLSVSYNTNGDWADWMYAEFKSLSITIETYGNDAAIKNINYKNRQATVGIWDFFNPSSKDMITLSNSATQPMLDYMANYPMQGTNRQHTLEFMNLKGSTVSLGGFSDSADLTLKLQYRNDNLGWETIAVQKIGIGTFSTSFDILGYQNKELRVFIGDKSRGLGYLFRGSSEFDEVISAPFANTTLPFESTTEQSTTIFSNTSAVTSSKSSSSLSTTISNIISSLVPTGESTSEKTVIGIFSIMSAGMPIVYLIRRRKNS